MSSAAASQDPTGTATLRERFARDFRSRWRTLRGQNREYLAGRATDSIGTRGLRAYRSWLLATALDTVVEAASGGAVSAGTHWTGAYVRQAYDKGLRDARRDLRQLGEDDVLARAATNVRRSEHRKHRAREYLTAYYEAEDVAYTLRKRAMREAADAVQADDTPTQLADRVNAEIESHGENATNALASTVIVETVNEAKLTAYELSDEIDTVGFDVEASARGNARHNAAVETAELVTVGDRRVCPDCSALEGTQIAVEDARANLDLLPPIHPNCRCYVQASAQK